jgi:hypothetical protein
MNEETINNNNDPISKEETAIINAAFKLHEIVIQHRVYRRGRGRSQFTSGSLVQARKALADLQPSVPRTNPVKVAAILAKNQDVASASIKLAIEEAKTAKREAWDSIRSIEPDAAEMKNLSEDAPIFKLFRRASQLDRVIQELGHDYLVPRVAHLASTLASKIDRELRPATEDEAA